MAERIFFLNTLRDGVSREQGERFLRERDIPLGRSLHSITNYTVTRLEGQLSGEGDVPYDYVDVVEVTSLADYRAEIASLEGTDEWRGFVAEWEAHIDASRSLPVYGTVLE